MKSKGFTLIELLAVIIILAIIALIATPIVLNIINNTKNSAVLRSAEYYINAVDYSIVNRQMNNQKIEDGTYNILSNGNICLAYEDSMCIDELVVSVAGSKPTSGKITIQNRKISAVYKLTIDNKKVSTNSKNELEIKEYQIYKITYENITETTNLIKEIEEGEILTIDLTGKNITSDKLKVKINNELTTNYTYENYILTIPNVKGNIIIEKDKPTLAEYIIDMYTQTTTVTVNKVEYSLDETHGLMNDKLGDNDNAADAGNIRYYGSNPNNYIDIGDRDGNNIIFWRIIGVFKDVTVVNDDNTTTQEDLVKIIRDDKLATTNASGFSFDYKYDGETTSSHKGWSTSTLKEMLNSNTGYYGSGAEYSYYNYSTTPTILDFESVGLSSNVQDKVANVQWQLGTLTTAEYIDTVYKNERGGTSVMKGKIGLMYASDYGYASDFNDCEASLGGYSETACMSTNWIYKTGETQWTIVSSTFTDRVWSVRSSGVLDCGNATYYPHAKLQVHPVLYLKSDVKMLGQQTATINGVETSYYVVE